MRSGMPDRPDIALPKNEARQACIIPDGPSRNGGVAQQRGWEDSQLERLGADVILFVA